MIVIILLSILGYLIYRDHRNRKQKEEDLEKDFQMELEIEKMMNKWR